MKLSAPASCEGKSVITVSTSIQGIEIREQNCRNSVTMHSKCVASRRYPRLLNF
uniref:Uncharacterized protein n=1 Tax=Daphnia magna TaxID=35525 RepID=A0A0P4XN47_9CRUS